MSNEKDNKVDNNRQNIFVLVRVSPALKDVGELTTIISNSLRLLYGDSQPRDVQVLELVTTNSNTTDLKELGIIRTDHESVDCLCAALTLATAPSFMNQYYRIDVLQIENDLDCLETTNASL